MIRLSEVYLDYAEALVQQGKDIGTAVEYINKVRRRGGSSDIATTDQTELLIIILNERKVEFCFEGKRFFDLKRAGKLQQFLGPLGWKDYMVNYPIPQEEIDLTKMEQNPGY
jgi:phosphosulfolactate synthase (CoM biosynthesis protein A)